MGDAVGAAIGFGSIVLLLFLGWSRRNRPGLPGGGDERRETALVVLLGVFVPVTVLVALFVYADVFVMRSTAAPEPGATALTIHVIGHQWFWEVRYPGTGAVTANEIHIPVGVPVDLVGTTADVIHSFWVPELNRKIDLIPGRVNRSCSRPTVPGVYRGQCSEFCGLQHAHMAVEVVAEPRAQFRAWLRTWPARPSSRRPGAPGAARRSSSRSVLGVSPDPRHGGARRDRPRPHARRVRGRRSPRSRSRTTAPPARLDRRPAAREAGRRMPALALDRAELTALVDYLESLR